MPGNSARCLPADHGVACLGINLGTTTALVWDTRADGQVTPNLMHTATRTASSSSRSPQFAIASDKSQSPLCDATTARYLAICASSTKDASIRVSESDQPVAPVCPKRTVCLAAEQQAGQKSGPRGKISLKISARRARTQSQDLLLEGEGTRR